MTTTETNDHSESWQLATVNDIDDIIDKSDIPEDRKSLAARKLWHMFVGKDYLADVADMTVGEMMRIPACGHLGVYLIRSAINSYAGRDVCYITPSLERAALKAINKAKPEGHIGMKEHGKIIKKRGDERRKKAYEMLTKGKSWLQIAKHFGVGVMHAKVMVKKHRQENGLLEPIDIIHAKEKFSGFSDYNKLVEDMQILVRYLRNKGYNEVANIIDNRLKYGRPHIR